MGSNPIWSSDFFRVSHDAKTYHEVVHSFPINLVQILINFVKDETSDI